MINQAIDSSIYCLNFKRALFLFGLIFTFQLSFAQTDTPCEGAQRWEEGAHWNSDGTINDAPNAPSPNGIIRCGSSAETQSQVVPYNNSIYDSTQFEIDISGIPCVDPSTQTTVFPDNPTNGQPIIWLNFDVRPFAGSFEIQINDNSGDEIAWVLYSSNAHQAGTTLAANGQQLSGDCGDLKRIACGVESSSTWNTIPIDGEDFLEPANMYLAVWDQDADGDLAINNFKARFGCGDSDQIICSLGVEDPIVSCTINGVYSVTIPINGANGQYQATDPNALSITSDVCLGNLGNGAISGSFTLTYNQGTNYNIDISTVDPSTNGCAVPLNPSQCTANVNGNSPPPGTDNIDDTATVCLGDSYVWSVDGNSYTIEDSPVTLDLIDNNGCSYTATLTITEYPVTPDDSASGEVCEGNTFNYEGIEYAVGSHDIPRIDANGCPYKTVLTVSAYPVTPDDTASGEVCEGNTFYYEGIEYALGSHDIPRIDGNGCPYKTVLTVTAFPVTPDDTASGEVCEGNTFNYEGIEYAVGSHDIPRVDANGCPYKTVLTVTAFPMTSDDTASGEVCEGNTFNYEGIEYAVGSHDIPRVDANGCPYKTVLTVTAYAVTPDDTASGEVCEGNTFNYEGIEYAVGSHDIPRVDANGCPYKTVLTVTAFPMTPDDTASGEVCEGNKYSYEGMEYDPGSYNIPKVDANGCPYTTVLTVTAYPVTLDIVNNVTVCEGDSYLWSVNGLSYTIADSPVEIDLVDANGCPYTASLTITEDEAPDAGADGTLTVCEGVTPTNAELFEALEGLPDEGGIWSGPVAGIYTYTFAASGSCPEVSATVTVDNYPVTPNDTASGEVCEGNTFNYEGIEYAVGSHDIPRIDGNGCPYKTVLTVTAFPVTPDDTASGEVCEGNTFNYEGIEYAVGSHDIPRVDANGCPYKTVLTVTAFPVTPDDTTSGEVCQGNKYSYEGMEYDPGSYNIPKVDANGCPYTTVLTVTAYPVTPDIVNNVTVCEGDSYLWSVNGLSYTIADSPVEIDLVDANGCPYTASLTITEDEAPDAGADGTLTVCEGVTPTNAELFEALEGLPDEGGIWSGPVVGVYTYTFAASGSCPEVSATVTVDNYPVTPNDTASGEVCEGNTFNYEGIEYAVGSHDIPRVDANGCPYKTVLTVTAFPVTPDDTASGEVCEGNTFNYEGIEYAVGSHDIPRIDGNGCPYKTVLTVTAFPVTPDDTASGEVCAGDTFNYEGIEYAEGSYDIPRIDANGCPYKTVLTVTAYPVTPDDTASGEVCEGNTFNYEGIEYAVGSHDIPRVDANGCPYKTVLTVTAYPVTPDDTASGEVCEGNTFNYEGIEYAVGSHDIPRIDGNGCPYKTVLTVTAYPVTPNDTASGEVCEGNKYTFEGLEYDPGTYEISKVDANGCSYTTVLTVTAYAVTPDIAENVTICSGTLFTWNVTGVSYSALDSPVVEHLLDENGCPYIATLTIEEYPKTEDIIYEAEVCPGDLFTWPLNGVSYSLFDSPVTIPVYDSNGCQYDATLILSPKYIEISHPTFETICLQGGIVPLFGGQPEGGVYSGPGVIDDKGVYSFDPTVLGEGVHGLTYTYGIGTGCEVGIKFKVEIIDCCVDEDAYAYAPNPGVDYEWCFLDSDQLYNNDWGWTNGGLDLETQDEFGDYNTYTFDLYVNSDNYCDPTDENSEAMLVGTVTLVRQGDDIIVTYEVDDSLSDEFNFELGDVNVHLDCDAFPCRDNSSSNRNIEEQERRFCVKTTDPQEYDHSSYSEDGHTASITIPVNSVLSEGCLDDFYLIAYADVEVCVNVEYEVEKERITDFDYTFDFKAYPVPYKDVITIAMELDFETDISIQVMDIRGMIIDDVRINDYVKNSEVKTEINLSKAKDQILFVKVTTNYGSVIKKIVSSNKK